MQTKFARKIVRRCAVFGVTGLLWTLAANGAILTYDLSAQWSAVDNPNGSWSYNQAGVPLLFHQNNWSSIPGLNGWTASAVGVSPPGWFQATVAYPEIELNDITVHSTSFDGPLANVTWTSPFPGTIDVIGQVWDVVHVDNRDGEWTLHVNNIAIASRSSVVGVAKHSAEADFASNVIAGHSLDAILVNAGDVVMFQIGKNPASSFGHFTGVEISIELTTVPVPAAAWLFGSGLGILFGRRCLGGF